MELDANVKKVLGITTLVAIAFALFWFFIRSVISPQYVAFEETHQATVQQVRDRTNYATRRNVENTARATITTYEYYKSQWEQYRDGTSDYDIAITRTALQMANQAAMTFNNYMRDNNFLFSGNIPEDIDQDLPILR